ncbi:cation:proton antiporter domain-containing protein [Pseudonocardia sp. TRM90224]|uniref:cation:proton antiporter domain-containing protein n=1 Tax=Pseudonocardia sp. TRM90224 TaxID=2812678 RepID=UPI001E5C759C|nr:cation:proton antiporter [Pseudonocardia sp. TRM90224]
MIPMMLAAAAAAVLRSLMAQRMERWNVGAPAVMVLAGALAAFTVAGSVAEALNTEVAQHAAEVILAVLLFVDAIEVRRGRLWGHSPGLAARLLLVAMPLSVLAAVAVGVPLFPGLALPALLVLACVVMPIDFAPSERVVRDRRLSVRMRSVLNVEGGYNDGIISPVFVFALALAAGGARSAANPLAALGTAVSHAVLAIVAGLVLGSLLGWLLDRAAGLAWTTDQSRRVVVVLAPLLTYAAAVAIGGNGFVASFVCGIAFRYVHRALVARRLRRPDHVLVGTGRAGAAMGKDFALLEDVTALMTMVMWFVVGLAGVPLIALVDLPIVVFCVLALTVLRIGAVWVAMLGSRLSGRERLLLGLLGPRGTTTIVFGLLAFNALPDGLPADTILLTTILCVVGSVVLHGLGSSPAIARLTSTSPDLRHPSAHTT